MVAFLRPCSKVSAFAWALFCDRILEPPGGDEASWIKKMMEHAAIKGKVPALAIKVILEKHQRSTGNEIPQTPRTLAGGDVGGSGDGCGSGDAGGDGEGWTDGWADPSEDFGNTWHEDRQSGEDWSHGTQGQARTTWESMGGMGGAQGHQGQAFPEAWVQPQGGPADHIGDRTT